MRKEDLLVIIASVVANSNGKAATMPLDEVAYILDYIANNSERFEAILGAVIAQLGYSEGVDGFLAEMSKEIVERPKN